MQQLTELRLGSATEKADGNSNTFTVDGFRAVLNKLETMPQLTVLDMQLPHVKKFNVYGEGTR
jgi:CheY-like chemotaxis protein